MPAVGKAGYSLIEVLVAVTLFSLTALSISAGVGRTIRTNMLGAHFTQATILAQDKLEELRAQSTALGDDSDTPQAGFTRTWEITPDAPEEGISRIDVTVSWSDDRPHTVTLTTVVNE